MVTTHQQARRLAQLLLPLLLLLPASTPQHIDLSLPGGRVFSYTETGTPGAGGTPELQDAAAEWCRAQGESLEVPQETCATMVTEAAHEQLVSVRAGASVHPRAGQFGLTPAFFTAADTIFVPAFGTEQMGPLLHSLIRFHRPEHVVELGFGYTTPFIAQALADNAANVASERGPENAQRRASILHDTWYSQGYPDYETRRRLTVIDDQSQRGGETGGFGSRVEAVLKRLKLDALVKIEASMNLAKAHSLFKPNSLGLVWNDAQWDPGFLQTWWPLIKKDGGLLLLHNVIGNGEISRWCVASPQRVLRSLFPDARFEFLTLLEPHKAYQGSVALIRRLDPDRAPDKYGFMWGGVGEDEEDGDSGGSNGNGNGNGDGNGGVRSYDGRPDIRQYRDIGDMLDRDQEWRPRGLGSGEGGAKRGRLDAPAAEENGEGSGWGDEPGTSKRAGRAGSAQKGKKKMRKRKRKTTRKRRRRRRRRRDENEETGDDEKDEL